MSHLDVNPDAVTDVGSRIAAAAETDAPQGGVSPAAQDPVSVALAQTFAARMAAITGHSSVAAAITDTRANLAKGSAHTYAGQEAANRAGLGQGPMPGTVSAPSLPTGSLPTAAVPTTIPSPAIGTPPPTGKAIATLIHSGAGPSGLYSAASQMRGHAAELTATADQLRSGAVDMAGDWDSEAGKLASSRITELGTWYGAHADHATAAATAIENQADNFGRARNAIPRPEQFADVERRLEMAMAANAMPGALGRYGPVIAQLKAELAKLNGEALTGYADYTTGAGDPSVVGDPLEPPPRPGSDIQMFDHDFSHRAAGIKYEEIDPLVMFDYTCATGYLGLRCRSPMPAYPVSRLVHFTLAVGTNVLFDHFAIGGLRFSSSTWSKPSRLVACHVFNLADRDDRASPWRWCATCLNQAA